MARRKGTATPPLDRPAPPRDAAAPAPPRDVAPPAPSPAASVPPAATMPGVPPDSAPPRRRFVVNLAAWLGVAMLAELAWVSASFLRPRNRDSLAARLFVAGPLDRFEPGSVTAFPSGRFYLVRLQEGGLLALHRECTHLGCTVPWDGARARFACPCHSSAFDITGAVLNAPAPRPLDYYPVRLENGIVKVDTRRRLSRAAFDASQVTVS